jgi:hypothetical protein
MRCILLREARRLASGADPPADLSQHPALFHGPHAAELTAKGLAATPYYSTVQSTVNVSAAIPCEYIVAEYLNGEDQLPRLCPAIDVAQATVIASHLASDKHRPVVKVFALTEGGASRLLLTVRR